VIRSISAVLISGILKKCPNCGKGNIYSKYLKVNDHCIKCSEELYSYRTDDFGPWLSIIMGGHIIVPLVLWVEQDYALDLWLQALIWIPLTILTVLFLLPISKSICLSILWRLRMKNNQDNQEK
jgi:uncharacterized protein (DUF983 family)